MKRKKKKSLTVAGITGFRAGLSARNEINLAVAASKMYK